MRKLIINNLVQKLDNLRQQLIQQKNKTQRIDKELTAETKSIAQEILKDRQTALFKKEFERILRTYGPEQKLIQNKKKSLKENLDKLEKKKSNLLNLIEKDIATLNGIKDKIHTFEKQLIQRKRMDKAGSEKLLKEITDR